MVFQDVARMLKDSINGYTYNVGDLLPPEVELAQRYSISRNTLRKALLLLEEDGMIERKHGSGTYVKQKSFIAHVNHMNSFSEIAHNSGKEVISQIMKFELQTASPLISRELNIKLNDPVYYIKRLRIIDDKPAQLEETWLSVSRFPKLTISHMKKSKFSYIEKECGIKIIGTFETFSPAFPTAEIASILHISTKDPVLKIQTQAVCKNHQPIDYSILYSNAFEFQVKYFLPR
ncbi:GntR family transcriptional regulator [Citrobacter koseri]|uniref:GntR family transcriptional regulator n=1 Tax=Citrobacter koseri TaxID=545 RepID=UPI002943B3CE|nr:GntR family transcriptional regulator [Citrobacter koseri]WOJ32157.1 GntR family transcriptional regulator [Citrobacter koseri]WOJ36330.1 GntR family transcriptional regulator [Citrobacter koseri]